MTPEEYCRNKAAPAGSNLYYCTLFHSPESKRKLNALFAFYHELTGVIYHASDPGTAKITLHWWSEEVERFFSGQARHPVTRALSAIKARDYLLERDLLNCISAMADFLEYSPAHDYTQWLRRHAATSGYTWKTAGLACRCTNRDILDSLATSGCCYGAFGLLRHTRHFATLGLNILPIELLNKHNLNIETIAGREESHSRVEFFTELFDRLNNDLKNCLADLHGDEENRLLFSITMLKILSALCQEYKSAKYQVIHTRVSLTPIRKLWISWRTRHRL